MPALALLIAGCSHTAPGPQQIPTAEIETSTEEPDNTLPEDQLKSRFEAGIAALAVQDYAKASRSFSELIRDYPRLAEAHANLALIRFKQQQYERARQLIDKAIELNPQQAQAYHLRAQLDLQAGEILNSQTNYQQAIALDPQYLNAHYNLALLYDIYLQDIALAIEHYTIYLSLLGKDDERTREWINHLKSTLSNG